MIKKIEDFALLNNLKEIRTSRDISVAVLAERTGVSRQALNEIENERRNPSLLTAFKLSWYFDTPIEDIFSFYVEG